MSRKVTRIQEFMSNQGGVNCARFGRNKGQLLATGGQDRKVNIWKVGCPTIMAQLHGHTSTVESVTFDADEEMVVSGSSGGTIKVWDLNSERMQKSYNNGHKTNVTCLDYHPFGNFFCSGSADTHVKVWDLRKKSYLQTYRGHTKQVNTLKFSPDGRWMVSGGGDGIVKLWDLTAGKQMEDFTRHSGEITCLDFHPTEFLLAVGSADRTITFWDLDKFKQISQTHVDARPIRSIRFTPDAPDGTALCAATSEALKVWGWEPVGCHDAVDIHWQNVSDLFISERSRELFGVSYIDSFVSIWNVRLQQFRPFAEPTSGDSGKSAPMRPPPPLPLSPVAPRLKAEHPRDYTVSAETKAARLQEVSQIQEDIQRRYGLLDTQQPPPRQERRRDSAEQQRLAEAKRQLRASQEMQPTEVRGGYQSQSQSQANGSHGGARSVAPKVPEPGGLERMNSGSRGTAMADADALEQILHSHPSMAQVLRQRLTNVKLIRSLWAQDRRGAIQHVQQLNDTGISVELVKQLIRKENDLSLDLCVGVLPVVTHVLTSPFEPHVIVGLEATSIIWHAFGDLIAKTLATKSYVVDVSLEDRKDKCRIARSFLGEIRFLIERHKDRKDDIGQRSRLLWKELPSDTFD